MRFSIGISDFTLLPLNASLGLICFKDFKTTIELMSGHNSNWVILTDSLATLKRFVRDANMAIPPQAAVPRFPQPPRSVQRRITQAIDREIQRQSHPQPRPVSPLNNTPPTTPRAQWRHDLHDVTPRTRRRAEVRDRNLPDSPQRRRLPRGPLQPIRMEPLQRRVLPRSLIARQPLDPNVNVAHKLGPFNERYLLVVYINAKLESDVVVVVLFIGLKI